MKRFYIKLVVFLLPIALLVLPVGFLLKLYGESFVDFEQIIKDNEYELIGQKFSESNTLAIKTTIVNNSKPKVVAIGSSRVLQFRKEMFREPFYNYGYTTTSIGTILPTLKLITEDSPPQYLILGLDQWNFNKKWDKSEYPNYHQRNIIIQNIAVPSIPAFLKEIFESKNFFNIPEGKIGLNAVNYNNGFRRDGSRDYGTQIEKLELNDTTLEDYQFRNTFSRIQEGNHRFQYGKEINFSDLQYIEDIIDYCINQDIKLFIFMPPFAPSVWAAMERSGNYNYIKEADKHVKRICNIHNIPYFNFSGSHLVHYSDSEMLDGFHGSERVYGKMLLHMAQLSSDIESIIDKDNLIQTLNETSHLNMFDKPTNISTDGF